MAKIPALFLTLALAACAAAPAETRASAPAPVVQADPPAVAPKPPAPPAPSGPDEKKLYPLGPDSQRQEGVPKGVVTKLSWKSQVFAGTVRDYWTYVPAQYDATKPHPLMIFQDGGGYVSETGSYRVPVVFDNLIHQKKIPAMIGLFINPGAFPPEKEGQKPRSNRSFEYDSLGDQYARFLVEELIPELARTLNISKEPADRAIGGASSGGICAFTAAWEKPDHFRKVLSHVGSFTNIRGGHVYAAMIRKTPPKPLRIFMQDGSNDLDNEHGNWPLANQELAASFKFKKYDYHFVYGEGKTFRRARRRPDARIADLALAPRGQVMREASRPRSHGTKHLPDVLEALKGVEGPVLDFGCGDGIFAEVSPCYVGMDLNPDAARRVIALGKPALAGDLLRAPLRTRSCAAVLCMNVLHGLAEPERVLLEIDRVLSPGGRVYLKNRWHKGGGRPATLGGRLSNALHLHRFRYWDHAWRHPAGGLFLSPNPDGTRGICPSCVRRWFESRGYDVRSPWSQVLVGVEGS